jgi:hypothetical protein
MHDATHHVEHELLSYDLLSRHGMSCASLWPVGVWRQQKVKTNEVR